MIKRIKEKLVMDNGFVKVFNDDVLFNGKIKGQYFRQSLSSRFPNYGVIGICEYEGKIVLLENFRYAHQKFQMETVKGMGMNDKTPMETMKIEVNEEIGGIIDKIELLGNVTGDMSDTELFCFKISIKGFEHLKHEDTEVIKNINLYSIEEVEQMISNNTIEDMVTIAAFLKYKLS